MKNFQNAKHVNHRSERRKFIVSSLSAGFAVAVCPLYAQSITNSNKASGKSSEQYGSGAPLQDAGLSVIKLFLCGDVMTGRGIDQVLPHPGNPTLYEDYMKSAIGYVRLAEEANGPIPKPVDYSYIWGDALAELKLRKPDLHIINLETAVTRSDDVQDKAVNYRMNPDNIPCITTASIDCCVLANNHVLDWGYLGLAETLDTMKKAGIKTTGAGRDIQEAQMPAIMPVSGKGRVLVYSFGSETSGVPWSWAATAGKPGVNMLRDLSIGTIRSIRSSIGQVKRASDIVVASIHWGGNWGYQVPHEQQEFARWLIDDAGVDIVHGHSSHHVKGIEVYQGKLILYGCGDFLNDYEGISGHESYRGDLSLMYFASVEPVAGKLVKLDMVPMQTKRFRLNHASGKDALWLRDILNREGKKFGSGVELVADTLLLRWTGQSG